MLRTRREGGSNKQRRKGRIALFAPLTCTIERERCMMAPSMPDKGLVLVAPQMRRTRLVHLLVCFLEPSLLG